MDMDAILEKRVTILGYGSQARAHAHNLQDSGVDVVVGLRRNSPNWETAAAAGLTVAEIEPAVQHADLLMFLIPDETHGTVYRESVASTLKPGAAIGFAHGFSVHYKQIIPRADLDVIMIAPKGPGPQVRASYLAGSGLATLIAVHQNASGQAPALARAYAVANRGGPGGILETSFREETETDLFGEQAVLCGGTIALAKAAFDTLVDAGYAPELAYFECVHELKLIADLLHAHGIAKMRTFISNTAEYGGNTAGPKIVTTATKTAMAQILHDIQSGAFAARFIEEHAQGDPLLQAQRQLSITDPIEAVGQKIRTLTSNA